ncbi:histidine phosphatase family protein [Mycobacterium shigaense]|uniref:Phosphoglycerate mutase n=1 Tax=Mycobacterium shigaense TaxID=722731 RepID=A0A1Z4ENX7_9MYCO|nr:histidine phosphatase family protein [Mycobacterium shigaense]MEA1122686.1 histidine phosphatase family protein [Mycobacterium shigaense]PRI14908.1 histidine phosphatase family protein [Mycobacterium shigaense]BAX94707.1 phosphoglycerate mutase [Mycobacterium shigaense]
MTDVVRLTLLSHAMTDAMATGRFPVDEPLNDTGRRQAEAAARPEVAAHTRQLTAPERRARQTAQLLGLQAATEPRLADLDCGRWRGQALDAVAPADLRQWLTEPAAAPHGGESVTGLIERVEGWLESLAGNGLRTVAVTHPAVIRAAIVVALKSAPASFWRVDVKPVGSVGMHRRGNAWTLRL